MIYIPPSGRTYNGGYVPSLTCNGVITLICNVTCETLILDGVISSNYNARVGALDATGKVCFRGGIGARNAVWHGYSDLQGNMTISSLLQISGNFRSRSEIIAGSVDLEGNIRIDGRLTASQITGCAQLGLGITNAKVFVVDFREQSRIAKLTGSNIIIHRAPFSLMTRLFLNRVASQSTFLDIPGGITGDYIDIEHVRAETVTGADVNIGPGCIINTVRYRDHIYIDENAWVGKYEAFDDPVDSESSGSDSNSDDH